MKENKLIGACKMLTILVVMMFMMPMAYAQIRSIDMEPIVTSPADGIQLEVGQQFIFKVSVTNHGPDSLYLGDTLVIKDNAISKGFVIVLGQAIGIGDTLAVFEDVPRHWTGPKSTFDFCTYLFDDPSRQVGINGSPLSLSYIDPNPVNNNACVEMTVSEVPSALDDLFNSRDIGLMLYPNPATDVVNLKLKAGDNSPVTVSIIDIVGREVLRQHFGIGAMLSPAPLMLNVGHLKAGSYLLTVESGNHRWSQKFGIRR